MKSHSTNIVLVVTVMMFILISGLISFLWPPKNVEIYRTPPDREGYYVVCECVRVDLSLSDFISVVSGEINHSVVVKLFNLNDPSRPYVAHTLGYSFDYFSAASQAVKSAQFNMSKSSILIIFDDGRERQIDVLMPEYFSARPQL